VLRNLKASIGNHPRKVTVVYSHPGHSRLESGEFPWLYKFDEFTTGLAPCQTGFYDARIG
jgi:hypothetical protein